LKSQNLAPSFCSIHRTKVRALKAPFDRPNVSPGPNTPIS
jgi:hypothetical protein